MIRLAETIEYWVALGNDIKITENLLLTNCKNSKGLSIRMQNHLIRTLNEFSKFKSETEDKMLACGFFPDKHDMSFNNVFYGKPKDTIELEKFIAEYKRKYETGKQDEKSA